MESYFISSTMIQLRDKKITTYIHSNIWRLS